MSNIVDILPKRHLLKVWPQFIPALEDGSKTFEARKDDRCFRVGDVLDLYGFAPLTGTETGWRQSRVITYKLSGPAWGVESGYCILGLSPLPPVGGIDDSGLVALRAEVARLKKEVEEERNHYKSLQQLAGEQVAALREDVKTWKDKETARYCDYAAAIGDRDALRKENGARRWECGEWQRKHDTLLMGIKK